MNLKIEFARKMALAYTAVCRPLCQEMKLPQTAFDILMFLYNNPEYKTARDIVEIRNIKANLVSVNVEKLVQNGYIERQAVENIPAAAKDAHRNVTGASIGTVSFNTRRRGRTAPVVGSASSLYRTGTGSRSESSARDSLWVIRIL